MNEWGEGERNGNLIFWFIGGNEVEIGVCSLKSFLSYVGICFY